MAKLIQDSEYKAGNLQVKVKKIPFGTKWKKNCCGFHVGELYKADRLMSGGTGIVKGITIHNTSDSADAETYTRATINQNMNTARVHFYVDSKEAWQNLEENEVGWHAGTGDRSEGNDTTIAIEIIMGGKDKEKDKKAEENGATLAAHLMINHNLSIDDIVTHKHWSGKNCPVYILPHWEEFKELVKEKCEQLLSKKYDEDIVINIDPRQENAEEEQSLNTDASRDEPDNQPDSYAIYPVYKAVENGILKGSPEGNLMLHSNITRQDLCVILDRLSLLPDVQG